MIHGKMDLETAIDWEYVLSSLFECKDIPKNQRVKISKSRLKGPTLTWWNFTQDDIVKSKKNLVTTWKKMVTLLREIYVLGNYEVQLHKKRMSLR